MRGSRSRSRGVDVLSLRCERDAAIEEARELRNDMERCLSERDDAFEEARSLRNGVVASLEKELEAAVM
jgi:uncharacterized coiled-coil DUF342 family protein